MTELLPNWEFKDRPVLIINGGIHGYLGAFARYENPGFFIYGIRHAENDWGKPISIEPKVIVNRWGLMITEYDFDPIFQANDNYLRLTQKQQKELMELP